ncbi:DUF4375 domain-containing protein [bacterium]|nr:DUF4375 domain-containing protein [bacterium]
MPRLGNKKGAMAQVNDHELISCYSCDDRRAEGDTIGESLDDPNRTVCILSLVHPAVMNGGVVMVFGVGGGATPFREIPDAYARVGCQREADIINRAAELLDFQGLDIRTIHSRVEASWDQIVETLAPLDDKLFEVEDTVDQKLAAWIREKTGDHEALK